MYGLNIKSKFMHFYNWIFFIGDPDNLKTPESDYCGVCCNLKTMNYGSVRISKQSNNNLNSCFHFLDGM